MYSVKEMYYTLQGEGAQSGRAAVFLRFAGCNLWTGREEDRHKAICKFCDTNFVGTDGANGGKFDNAQLLAASVNRLWQATLNDFYAPLVVCTGGEPLLQLDACLVEAFQDYGFEVAVETNGTISAEGRGIDWICVSPKAKSGLKQLRGNELKLVYPQLENEPEDFEDLDFRHFFIQPKDEEGKTEENTGACVEYCLKHPQWRLSLQTHKILKIA